MELTDVKFWEDYWANVKVPNVVDMSNSFDRCLSGELQKWLAGCRGEVLEVGCAPGKWLSFLAEKMGLNPSGIEYTSAGTEATVRNFSVLGLNYGHVWSGDFFSIDPDPQFDVVISLGFIEHFQNVEEVVERHLQWLKPGGVLLLEIPNFRGVYYPIQSILDKTLLDKHNLKIMNLEFFKELAGRFGMTIRHIGYACSFEPCLPILPPDAEKTPLRFIFKMFLLFMHRLRRWSFLDRINGRYFSAAIIAVYQKGSDH